MLRNRDCSSRRKPALIFPEFEKDCGYPPIIPKFVVMDSQPPLAPSPRFHGEGLDRRFSLPRLPREYYQADSVVHWTMPVALAATGWLTKEFHAQFREITLHSAVREGLFCPIYCLMPDHIHLVWMGLRLDTDQRRALKFLREHLGPALRPHRFQHQAHDSVFREEKRRRNAFTRVCNYILENPVRAALVKSPQEWPFTGGVVPGCPTLHPFQANFWAKFWKIYLKARASDAGNLLRPPIN